MKIELSRKEFLTIYNALCYQQICLVNENLKGPSSEKTARKIKLIGSSNRANWKYGRVAYRACLLNK